MPKKPNRWQQPQNYVPKGNGDASGEYADDGGLNTHFTTFKKPIENNTKETKNNGIGIEDTGNGVKPIYTGKEHSKEEITSIVQKAMGVSKKSVNVDRVIAQLEGDNWNKDIKSLVIDTFASGRFKIIARKNGNGVFKWGSEICFSSEVEDNYTNGEVMAHETGHAIDYTYSGGMYSKNYVSEKYNKTMYEMLDEELDLAISNGLVDGIEQEMINYREKLKQEYKVNELLDEYRKLDKEHTEISDEYDKIKENWLKENTNYYDIEAEKKTIINKFMSGDIGYDEMSVKRNEYTDKMTELQADAIKYMKDNHKELNERLDKSYNKYSKAYQEYASKERQTYFDTNKKYMDISDILQGKNLKYKFCGGHANNYFTGWNGNRMRATECFAEITSAIGTNKESLEVLQRFIPKTIEIYKEIIGGLNKNGKE